MHTPKAVVFDLGKVLLDFDFFIASQAIAKLGRLSPDQIKHLIDHSPLLFRYETGLMTTGEFYNAVCHETGYTGNAEQFGLCFGDIFQEITPMVELQAALRRNRIPTYIFSNTNELAVAHIRRNFPFFSNFDGYVLSYEHKSMKPQPQIYEVVERLTGRKGPDLLYIDDRPENVQAGAERGWQVILQQAPSRTIEQVARLGLLSKSA